jgi:hypothetical protein
MLAHVSPVLIFTFWGVLIVAIVGGISACAGSFFSRRRRHWFLVGGLVSIAAGSWLAYVAVQDGALRDWSWFTFVALAPVLLGVVTLVRWSLLRA